MAEEIKVTIGADTSQLRAQLTLAENDLKAFQLEIKRSTNVTDIAKLQNSITILTTKVATLKNTLATSGTGMDSLAGKSRGATSALTDLSRIAQDAPYGFMAISNNLNPMLESFQRLKMESGSTGGALKAMAASLAGPAGIGIALAVVSSAIVAYNQHTTKTKEVTDEAKKALEALISPLAHEATEVSTLIGILKNENETRDRKVAALKELKSINPEIFGQLNVEKNAVVGLNSAYDAYIGNLKNLLAIKIIQAKLDKEFAKLIELDGSALTKTEQNGIDFAKSLGTILTTDLKKAGAEGANMALQMENVNKSLDNKKQKEIAATTAKIKDLNDALQEFSKKVKLPKDSDLKTDKIKKDAETVTDVLKKLNEDMRDQQAISIAFDKSTLPEQMKLVESAITKLISDFNLSPDSNIIMGLKADVTKVPGQLKNLTDYNELLARVSADAYYEEYQKRLAQKEKNPQKDHKMKVVAPKLEMTELGKQIDDQLKQVNSALQSGLQNIIIGFAEALGAALSGDMGFGDFFKALFAQVGAGMQQFGKVMIGFAIKAELLKKWAVANPALAIAAGIGLIALGALIKNQTVKNAFAVGTRNAPGGLSLVGERGPELVNIPRGASVIPAAQTSNMMGGMGGAVEVFGVLRGQDIYFSNKKYGLSYGRQT
jgi:hypothetical protein